MADTMITAVTDAIDAALAGSTEVYVTLPGVDLPVSEGFRQALDGFSPVESPAGNAAARWLRDCALVEHLTSRTTVLLGRGRVLGFYSLASTYINLGPDDRASAGVRAERRRVPGTLMTWIARDPDAEATGGDLLRHAAARARRAHGSQATAVMVLDAYDEATAEMWLTRPYPLHVLDDSRKPQLWMALEARN